MASHVTRTMLLALVGAFLALSAGCLSDEPGEPLDGGDDLGAADGFGFVRALEPMDIEVDGSERSGTFDPDQYVAYTFEVAEATRIRAELSWGLEASARNLLDCVIAPRGYGPCQYLDLSYTASMNLFRLDGDAEADDPMDRWDLVTSTLGETFDYDIVAPGTFLIVVLASPAAYENAASFTFALMDLGGDLESRAPGNLHLTLVTHDGRPAAALRVGAGTAEGRTEEDGAVLLEGVEAGVSIIRLGPDGLGRLFQGGSIGIPGNGTTRHAVGVVNGSEYDRWMHGDGDEQPM